MKIVSTIVFLTAFVFCAQTVKAQEKIKLEYDFQAGKKLDYQVVIDGDVTVEVQPADGRVLPKNSAKMEGKFNYTHKIVSVGNDKSAKIDVIYGPSYMNTIVNDQVIPNADVPLLNGKIAHLTVDNIGEIKDFRLPDELPASLQNADFKKMFLIFPDRQLRIGESWIENSNSTDKDNDNYVVETVGDVTHTLLGVEKKGKYECAKVKVLGNTSTTTKSKKKELKLEGKAQGRIEGTVYFDLNSGHIVYSDMHTKMNNVVTTGAPTSDESGDKNPQSVTTIMDTDLKTITELL